MRVTPEELERLRSMAVEAGACAAGKARAERTWERQRWAAVVLLAALVVVATAAVSLRRRVGP